MIFITNDRIRKNPQMGVKIISTHVVPKNLDKKIS
jgi:hypothetical protein